MGAWDEPPKSPRGFFDCLVGAAGAILLLTGGVCAYASFSAGRAVIPGLIGIVLAVGGWLMMTCR